MYISKIKLTNFRIFSGDHEIEFNSGINFFVGNNNSGKTTVFKAIEFLQSGKSKVEYITKGKEKENVSVEVTFSGDDIPTIVESDSLKKYQHFIFDENNTKNLRIMRSSSENSITQDGKNKNLSIKNVRTWNPETQQFENPTGIDSTITALFDAQFVYSDLKNEDYQDFGKTKIVGKLINAITANFQQSQEYQNLLKAHKTAFGDTGLLSILTDTQGKIQTIMREQYGEAEIKFDFGLPEMESFFKNGSISLTDNGITTDISQKGTGMQRALALSLIQVYSDVSNEDNAKQLFFFIDEPETFLHPQAQDKLINSFERISENSQVFISTHSPYLLKKFSKRNHGIKIFSSTGESVIAGKDMNCFPFSPTWGEINYFAFDVTSIEFHNELYGHLQAISNIWSIKDFDDWLVSKGVLQNTSYIFEKNGVGQPPNDKTLPTFVRNIIHHPENQNNHYTLEQLRESIETMLAVLATLS